MKTFFFRSFEDDQKLIKATEQVIELLRKDLKLSKWECYFVIKMLFEGFPKEALLHE